jgi:hypothetical protein
MKIKYLKVISSTLLLMTMSAGLIFTHAAAISWKTGRVISASISGHGPAANSRDSFGGRKDLWWNYCVSTGDQSYSVLSRENPALSGLKVDSSVKFFEKRNQIFFKNPSGKQIGLKIFRKDQGPKCP